LDASKASTLLAPERKRMTQNVVKNVHKNVAVYPRKMRVKKSRDPKLRTVSKNSENHKIAKCPILERKNQIKSKPKLE